MSRSNSTQLVWCGMTSHPEFRPAYEYCRTQVAIHLRCNLQELIDRPVIEATHLLIERLDRTPIDEFFLQRLRNIYSNAKLATLEGKLCAGLGRTGPVWQGFVRLPWTSTTVAIQQWLERPWKDDNSVASFDREKKIAIALFAGKPSELSWLAECFAEMDIAVATCLPHQFAYVEGMTAWIWDESAIEQFGTNRWLSLLEKLPNKPRQVLLTSFPTWSLRDQIAQQGIIMVAKPFDPLELSKLVA